MLYGYLSRGSYGFNASRIVSYLRHLSVGTDVYIGSRPTYMQHVFVRAFVDLELDYCES